jgi:hypothetical protein
MLREPKAAVLPLTPVPVHPECDWMHQRELQQLQVREQQHENEPRQGSKQNHQSSLKLKVKCCHCSEALQLALQKPQVTLTKHARECKKMKHAINKYDMLRSLLSNACARAAGTATEQQLAALRACKTCSSIVNSSCKHTCKSSSNNRVDTAARLGDTSGSDDPVGSSTPLDTPPSTSGGSSI